MNRRLSKGKWDPISVNCRKSRKYGIYVERFYENVVFHAVSFKDNIWDADFTDMQLISTFHKGTKFLSCVTDIFSKYAWVVRLKDKKGITIVNAFQKILDNSLRKPKAVNFTIVLKNG